MKERSLTIARVGQQILLWQRQLADFLNQKCHGLSTRGLLMLLIIFCVLVSAILARLIINAIQ